MIHLTTVLCVAIHALLTALQPSPDPKPAATIDLMTRAGVDACKAQWRYIDVTIVPTPDGKTHDIEPKAGAKDFDDAKWQVIEPESLPKPRGPGRLSFAWYRIRLTIPPKVGDFDTTGSTVVFDTIVDDYGEIWLDGQLPLALNQSGGHVVKGWNAPNRLVIARDAKPGQQIQLAIFGINAPLSAPPENFIFLRHARVEFQRPGNVPAK